MSSSIYYVDKKNLNLLESNDLEISSEDPEDIFPWKGTTEARRMARFGKNLRTQFISSSQ